MSYGARSRTLTIKGTGTVPGDWNATNLSGSATYAKGHWSTAVSVGVDATVPLLNYGVKFNLQDAQMNAQVGFDGEGQATQTTKETDMISRISALILSVVALAAAALAPSAQASGPRCHRIDAHSVSGNLAANGPSAPSSPSDIPWGDTFLATTKNVLTYEGNRYTVAKGTVFKLGCFASQKAASVIYPDLDVLMGRATVQTVAGQPGGLHSSDILVNPVGHSAQSISITVTGNPRSPAETTLMTSTGPIVDITPELGVHNGHCIYHHSVRAVASYHGGISFSMTISVLR